MTNELEIRTLTERFFEGQTTLEEEQRLYALYRTAELPDDLLPLREMMLDVAALPSAERQPAPRRAKTVAFRRHYIAVAASLLLLAGVAWAWYGSIQQSECITYVYGQPMTDVDVAMQEMKTAMATFADDKATTAAEEQLKELFSE